jgi:predicted nucleic-acid-binding protein
MAALDTNVLVRFLVKDDAKQYALAERLIRSALRAGQSLFVPVTVFLELEWALRSNFGFTKSEVIGALSNLLSAPELSIESESAMEIATVLYQSSRADFSDCVHAALAHRAAETPLWTFDQAAAKIDGARLLK